MAKDKTPVVHVVLFMRTDPKAEFKPIHAVDETDPGGEDDLLSHKVERLIHARKTGAPRPEFKLARQQGGEDLEG